MHTDDHGDLVRLSLIIPLLLAEGWEPPEYRTLWLAALDGAIPAEQVRGRWHSRRQHIPAIARTLRLRKRPGPKPADLQQQQTVAA